MNIVFITIDAWRRSHASFYPDGHDGLTPNLERFASEGVVFTQAISHGPATPYAFPSLFTSTLPLDHGGYESIQRDRTLLSEQLSAAGWQCAGVHANPWLGAKYGYGRGYGTYRDTGEFSLPLLDRLREQLIDRFGLAHPMYRVGQLVYRYLQSPLSSVAGDDEVSAAIDLLTDHDDDRYLWVHILDPHAPYTPPARHRRAVGLSAFRGDATKLVTKGQRDPESLTPDQQRIIRKLYAAAVRHADERVGLLLDRIDDSSLVVVTADHGEALFEHGQLGHEPALFDELIRVPLLIRPPVEDTFEPGRIDAQVRHIDIPPTILDYAGVEPPGTFRGRSLKAAIEGADRTDRVAISEVASPPTAPGQIEPSALRICCRLPDRKLVYTDGAVRGFELSTDPTEQHPIVTPAGEDWRPLSRQLDERLDFIDLAESESIDRPASMENRLRALGYLD